MGTLINQELYKLLKQKSSIIIPIIIFLLMIALAIIGKNYSDILKPEEQFKQGFSGFAFIFFLMIVKCSTIITMEFHYGTIKNLLSRKHSRTNIIISKIITLVIYSVVVFIITIAISILLAVLLFPDLDIFKHSGDQQSLLQVNLFNALASYVGMWFLLCLTLLISCILKNPGVSIAIGIVFYFAVSILSSLLFTVIDKWEWLKWNPLNMLNLSVQIIDDDAMKKLTKLSLQELFIGNIVYITIFLVLVVISFKSKRV